MGRLALADGRWMLHALRTGHRQILSQDTSCSHGLCQGQPGSPVALSGLGPSSTRRQAPWDVGARPRPPMCTPRPNLRSFAATLSRSRSEAHTPCVSSGRSVMRCDLAAGCAQQSASPSRGRGRRSRRARSPGPARGAGRRSPATCAASAGRPPARARARWPPRPGSCAPTPTGPGTGRRSWPRRRPPAARGRSSGTSG
jgi:hypothetical protein